MWWRAALIVAAFLVTWVATTELVVWLLKKSVRKWFDKELADLVREVEEEERKREERE